MRVHGFRPADWFAAARPCHGGRNRSPRGTDARKGNRMAHPSSYFVIIILFAERKAFQFPFSLVYFKK
jgi:hypothetical protein